MNLSQMSIDGLRDQCAALEREAERLDQERERQHALAADAYQRQDAAALTAAWQARDAAIARRAEALTDRERIAAEATARLQPKADQWGERCTSLRQQWLADHQQAAARATALVDELAGCLAKLADASETWPALLQQFQRSQAAVSQECTPFPVAWPAVDATPPALPLGDLLVRLLALVQPYTWGQVRIRPPFAE